MLKLTGSLEFVLVNLNLGLNYCFLDTLRFYWYGTDYNYHSVVLVRCRGNIAF